ncbi:succinylglutamate-semialdehyde dehydrogenase [Sphingomicrobium astaxanthinifaciens]|uniref:succinylglutamate-semialdehyde dehydrogenase n=1 Tax=Sphingomicrobium astaxanthinifaciens TaxID=1227949 RepID=UPI001FCAAE5B|nr:succinylglutamate-semialdehyde dehydrogenase [Sphingomicrobium astaxanthinifaciens]MCJ7420669.1 succinylglutamate-semialdehyde dehydrogenase [Sphingomicrobium astaxanthinifaciens]
MSMKSFTPYSGEEIWSGEEGDPAAAIAAAREAQPEWARQPLAYRTEALRRFANIVREREDDLARLIAMETGKPHWEAKTEVGAVIGKVDISVTAHNERTPSRKAEGAMNTKIAVRHKPHGVMAVLGPYNFPAHLPNGHIVPALLAGNAVVFKPSEKTPAVGEMLAQCFHDAGIDERLVACVQGGPEVGKALAASDDIDGLLFTGSAKAGRLIHRAFADKPQKILAIEAGGNNPLIAWDLPDLDAAAAIIVQSAFLSAGQRCTCARRLIVEDGKHERLLEKVLKLTDRIIVDEPFAKPAPFMGPVIDNDAADFIQAQYIALLAKGGKAIRQLKRLAEDKPLLGPAIVDVTGARDRLDEEIFGPVLQLIRVPDFDAAIAEANNTRFGLAASILTKHPEQYERFWAEGRAGVINWNKPTNGAPSTAPFGGIGISGNHRPSAFYAADYCAYPVTSVESDLCRAKIDTGLADPVMLED